MVQILTHIKRECKLIRKRVHSLFLCVIWYNLGTEKAPPVKINLIIKGGAYTVWFLTYSILNHQIMKPDGFNKVYSS